MDLRQVSSNEQTWRFPQGERHVRSWVPEDARSEQFWLGVVHGLGDHSGRFDSFGRWFAQRGVSVFCFDQVGHGKSPGKRVVIPSYDFLIRDIEAFLDRLKADSGGVPVGLFGQSMGGNLVLNHQLRSSSEAAFVVAGSPMLRIPKPPSAAMALLYRSLALFVPNLILNAPVDPENLSRDPEVQTAFVNDPLVEQKVSLRLGIALIDSGQWALDRAHILSLPTLLTHGDADRITCHRASLEFGDQSDGRAEVEIWKGGVHDLHSDDAKDEYLNSIFRWMRSQFKNG